MVRKSLCVVCLVAAVAVFLVPTQANAQRAIRWMPPAPPSQPLLGFNGHMEYGRGMVVDSVWPGTAAAAAGLERGDVIVRINGVRINSYSEYLGALRDSDGYAYLRVLDVRGRGIVATSVRLNSGSGPLVVASPGPRR